MPAKSAAQERLMEAAAHTPGGYGGVPQSVGQEFVRHDGQPKYAGVLIVNEGQLFLVHRTDKDEWEGPGGHIEEGETPEEAAIRETEEEVGINLYADMLGDPVKQDDSYTSFVIEMVGDVPVNLNHEHDQYGYFDLDDLPAAAHPNVKKWAKEYRNRNARADSLGSPELTETDIARAIRDGKLESPQRLDHVWLFDLRVTGTGVAYRASLDEWVYRPPEFYLTDEFLERCQGLPVLFDHPEKGLTDTEEWRQRAIGALVLPYIPDHDDEFHATNEVWAIARIYDDDAAELMLTTHISTSPAVEFSGKGDLRYTRTDDGDRLLIEDKPMYIDHLAIVPEGVWDKMTTPRGVAQ